MAAQKKNLVIVESPSKAKTIGKYLGSKYVVIASAGHIVDLPKSRMAIDFNNNFAPEYINVRGKGDTIKEIKKEAKEAGKIYLATDPDREGEAISWHIANLLGIAPEKANRIEFHEITKSGVKAGFAAPRAIDMNLVDAQQGRRVMDRIVGYGISPVLWAKAGRGLSAGRVQSSALKIICDREKEVLSFNPVEYWIVEAELSKLNAKSKFKARLEKKSGKKYEINDKAGADQVKKDLADAEFVVSETESKQRSKKPYAPYITSTMQQDASVKLNFSPSKTMMIAQRLYESGYISYHRTDSVRISEQADAAAKSFIKENYGEDYVGNNFFSNKNKGAQDAHEAIRPTDVEFTPQRAASSLSPDDARLYRLIWSRFIASRMAAAVYNTVSVDITAGIYGFKANGSSLAFEGYIKVYADADEEASKKLPAIEKGEKLKLISLDGEQKFTEPPARFTEASLIKELESKGIGRPSTYAPIVSTLTEKRYVKKQKKSLIPTELGNKVTYEIMVPFFREVVDADFTAQMENDLDSVEAGNTKWQKVVADCYDGYLKDEIKKATEELEHLQFEPELTGEICPECGKPLAVKHSRFGEFIGCTGYPDCKYTKPIVKNTGVKCPKCGGDIIAKKGKSGKTFYGCSNYPDCKQAYWYKPVQEECPVCGSLLVVRGKKLVCSNSECKFSKDK